jgi:hypothetical protein
MKGKKTALFAASIVSRPKPPRLRPLHRHFLVVGIQIERDSATEGIHNAHHTWRRGGDSVELVLAE